MVIFDIDQKGVDNEIAQGAVFVLGHILQELLECARSFESDHNFHGPF